MQLHRPACAALALLTLSLVATCAFAADPYPLGPDSQPHDDVPHGTVTTGNFKSHIFAETRRDYWVYVPAQYDASKPACVMIFNDGGGYQDPKGQWRVPIVFDNLINKKEMPVTIGVFVNPGVIPAPTPQQAPRNNRSFEYDTPTDQYARFLLEEMLPEVAKTWNLTKDGTGRAIAGLSSGGICAFTAAWERPTEFTRVASFIGSFTNLRGGNQYPDLIRKNEPKAIRVFLQDGDQDLNNFAGSWWIANQDMDKALEFAGYEHQFIRGTLGHDARQGGSILPDVLRYLWKDYPALPKAALTPAHLLSPILSDGEPWQTVAEGFKFTEGPAADSEGNVYFTDIPNSRIHKVDAAGKVSVFAEDTGAANGLMFAPDGRLYACQGQRNRVVAYDVKTAKEQTIADEIEACNDLAIAHDGGIYVTEPPKKQVWYIAPGDKHEKKVVSHGIGFPNGVRFTTDQSQLIVADTRGVSLFLFTVHPDGALGDREPYFPCQIPAEQSDSGADGLTLDQEGRAYVATRIGVQVFDREGRVVGIIDKPQRQWLANVAFGGKELDYLYAACGDKLFRRKTKTHGVLSWQTPALPVIPPKPATTPASQPAR